jgi:hypothetical protein
MQIAGCFNPPQAAVLVFFQSTSSWPGAGHALANHNQYGQPPKGSFGSPTGADWAEAYTGIDGCAKVTWYAPIFSGFYDIVGFSNLGADYLPVVVYINDEIGQSLVEMAPLSDYSLIGATPPHPVNHFGTATTVALTQTIMSEFRQQTGKVAGVNDMSLVWGGKFDFYRPNSQYGCWSDASSCPHAEHRKGRNVDVDTGSLGTFKTQFLAIATLHGGAGGGPIKDEGNHLHLRFQY